MTSDITPKLSFNSAQLQKMPLALCSFPSYDKVITFLVFSPRSFENANPFRIPSYEHSPKNFSYDVSRICILPKMSQECGLR